MSNSLTPWRPPLFEALASPSVRSALHLKTPSVDGRAYLAAFLADPTRWRYAVVDEMVDDMVGVVVSPWPVVDGAGRLRQPPPNDNDPLGGAVSVHVPRASLQAFLEFQRGRARALGLLQGDGNADPVTRDVRIGDAFALGITGTDARQPKSPPRERVWVGVEGHRPRAAWLRGVTGRGKTGRTAVVLDLGVDAREAARVAYYAAMAPELHAAADHDIIAGAVLSGLEAAAGRAERSDG